MRRASVTGTGRSNGWDVLRKEALHENKWQPRRQSVPDCLIALRKPSCTGMTSDGKPILDSEQAATQQDSEVVWVVGMDGSRLSFRCLRLASMLMDNSSGKHHVLALHVSNKDGPANSMLTANAQEEARLCGIPMKNFAFKTLRAAPNVSIPQTIVHYVNNSAGSQARLVIGGQGMKIDDYTGTASMDHLGTLAAECMAKVKGPVVVVKQAWREVEGQRDPLGRVLRNGHSGKPGLKIFCTIDDSLLSEQAFHFAMTVMRPGDEFVALHVSKPARDVDSQEREAMLNAHYKAECEKLAITMPGLKSSKYMLVPRTNNSISEDILEAIETEEADLVVMGSMELANPRKSHQLGSVCSFVARHAKTHVLIIKNKPLQ